MGRKSLKSERVAEILNAFECCLEAKGLQATTLDDIAEEAGMARRMVRHYIGNRDDVVSAGVLHIISKFNTVIEEVLANALPEQRFETALNYIFSQTFNDHPSTQHVAALLPVSLYNEQVKNAVKTIYDSFHQGLQRELALYKPLAQPDAINKTAYSIMSLSFGGGWMRNIGFDHQLNKNNKELARAMIDKL